MAKNEKILPLFAGVAGGLAVGVLVTSSLGAGAPLPRIDANPASPVAGSAFIYTFSNFPPNTQLVGPVGLNPLQTVNIGTTDATGKVIVSGTAPTTAGTYAAIAWDAPTGKYCAYYTLVVR